LLRDALIEAGCARVEGRPAAETPEAATGRRTKIAGTGLRGEGVVRRNGLPWDEQADDFTQVGVL